MKKVFWFLILLILGISCNGEREEERQPGDLSNYEVASERYSQLTDEALNRMSALEFDSWGEMLSRDVEYYFPDGDYGSRTVLRGKNSVLYWWENWRETSAIDSMKFTERVHVPVQANKKLNYSGLTGVIVISYFSNRMVYNGQPVSVRTNTAMHFDDDSLIDRIYTYYDRTPILNTVQANALEIVVYRDSLENDTD